LHILLAHTLTVRKIHAATEPDIVPSLLVNNIQCTTIHEIVYLILKCSQIQTSKRHYYT